MNIQCCFPILFSSSTGIKESNYRVRQMLFLKQPKQQHLHCVTAIPFGFQALPSGCGGEGQPPRPAAARKGQGFTSRPLPRAVGARLGSPHRLLPRTRSPPQGTGSKRPASTSPVRTTALPTCTSPRQEDVATGRNTEQATEDIKPHTLCQPGAGASPGSGTPALLVLARREVPGQSQRFMGFEAQTTALKERLG